jgi:hypothetical protein
MTEDDIVRAVTAKLTGPPRLGSWVRVTGQAFRNYEGEVTELHRLRAGPRYGVKLEFEEASDLVGQIVLFWDWELEVLR